MKIVENHHEKNHPIPSRRRKTDRTKKFSSFLEKGSVDQRLCATKTDPALASAKKMTSTEQESQSNRLAFLGIIDRQSPTVSNLLIDDPQFSKDCWRIVHADINRHKPFTRMLPGTPVFLDPSTNEIFWEESFPPPKEFPGSVAEPGKASQIADREKTNSCGSRLASAVQSFIGRGYDEIDCYELLVNGLQLMGVQYQGNDGLKAQLVRMAREEGLSENAYLSGEGIVEASGKRVYDRTLLPLENSEKQARQIKSEITSVLDNGHILSFSTPTRGHTGVVDHRNGKWVFVNSGRLDHPVANRPVIRKGVGEEDLEAEIVNWLRLAAARKEPLRISIGCLVEDKLSAFIKPRPSNA